MCYVCECWIANVVRISYLESSKVFPKVFPKKKCLLINSNFQPQWIYMSFSFYLALWFGPSVLILCLHQDHSWLEFCFAVCASPLISVDPTDQKKTACYDIDVEVDDPLKGQMNGFLSSTTNQQEIAALEMKASQSQMPAPRWLLDKNTSCLFKMSYILLYWLCSLQIHETIEYINQLKTERDFMLSFSNKPQDFIQDWLKSQCRDLKVNI